jgi:signal transduction histidine kinase
MPMNTAGLDGHHAPSRWQVPLLWLAGLIGYSVCIWLSDDAAAAWINDLAWSLAAAAAALVCMRTATRVGGSGWWLLGAGCASWFVGQLFWTYNELVLGIALPYESIGQVFYSSLPLLMIAGISRLREAHQDPQRARKQLGNIGLVICCLIVTILLGLVEPALQSGQSHYLFGIGLLHNLAISATFLYSLYVLWTYRWRVTWMPMLLLVIATGIYAISNLLYAHAVITRTYMSSDVINMSWLVVFGVIAWAAAERAWVTRSAVAATPDGVLLRERWIEAVIPALLIIIMVIVTVSSVQSITPRMLLWATGMFVMFAIILGVREALIQSDAQRLNDELTLANRRLSETIAELRDSELRYRDLNAELERRVAERTAELERAYGELEGFSYAVAHDLKAPLRAINGFAHLLRDELGASLDERSSAHLNRIRGGALKMSALIDDLLSYAHIERRDLHASQIHVRLLIDSLLDEFDDEIQPCGVQVTMDVEDVTVFLDAEGLMLVLRNLLSNALKYSCEGSTPAIAVRVARTVNGVLLSIADNGIGFDMQFHERIFKLFQRLHRDDRYPGTGIGLALVRKAVERIGGRVWAQSKPGEGATFFVELPNAVVV